MISKIAYPWLGKKPETFFSVSCQELLGGVLEIVTFVEIVIRTCFS